MLKGYITITILLLTDLVLYLSHGISLSGQVGDKVLFWIWIISTPVIIFKFFKEKWTRWYIGLIGTLLIASWFPMGVPMISIISFAIDNNKERKVEKYILREGAKSVLAIPKIYLLKNCGFLEKEIGETSFNIEINHKDFRLNEIEEIKLVEEKDSLVFKFILQGNYTFREFKKE